MDKMIINIFHTGIHEDSVVDFCNALTSYSTKAGRNIQFYSANYRTGPEDISFHIRRVSSFTETFIADYADTYNIYCGTSEELTQVDTSILSYKNYGVELKGEGHNFVDGYKVAFDFMLTALMIISPPSSGSSYLKLALQERALEINSYDEIELNRMDSIPYIFPMTSCEWSTTEGWVNHFYEQGSDRIPYGMVERYDRMTQASLYYQGMRDMFKGKYFLDKWPELVKHLNQLDSLHPLNKKIILVRDPYACLAGNYKYAIDGGPWTDVASIMLKYYVRIYDYIISNPSSSYVLITYEDLADKTQETTNRIVEFLEIESIDISSIERPAKNHGNYGTDLVNYNSQAISQIPQEVLADVRAVFTARQDVFDYFGYTL